MVQKFRNLVKRLGKWFWIILIIVLIGFGFFFFKSSDKKTPQTTKVESGKVSQELILTGSVNAEKYASLYFPTSGKIAWVGVKEGQQVKRGMALSSLDKTVLNSAYQDALNTYRNYQAVADQVLDSVKGHGGDETFTQRATRTTAEVNRDNAYEAVNAARYNLANATIYAPFDGIISSPPFTSPGVNVSLADAQIVIVDPATIYFDVDADQNDVTNLKVGQKVMIVLDSYQDKEFSGSVSFISYTPKQGVSGTNYRVKVLFDGGVQSDLIPRIGMTGDAKFILSEKASVLFVPSGYVNSDNKGKYLNVGSEKNKVYIETGLEGEERTEVVSDNIKVGDVVFE